MMLAAALNPSTSMDTQALISFGGIGVLAAVLYKQLTLFISALQTQVDARIKYLEDRLLASETENKRLQGLITSILERNAHIDVAREKMAIVAP